MRIISRSNQGAQPAPAVEPRNKPGPALDRPAAAGMGSLSWGGVGLLVLVLVGFALRAYRLDFQSIWTDEGFVVSMASRSFADLVAVWSISPQEGYAALSRLGSDLTGLAVETDIHPPLYYFLVHFWMPLAGRSEYALRFLSAFFGLLTLPLLFVLGRRLAGQPASLIAVGFAALSPFYLDFSQQVRMYTLVTFLAILSMYSFHRAFGGAKRSWWAVYSISVALALYTHYFAITVVLVQGLLAAYSLVRGRADGRHSCHGKPSSVRQPVVEGLDLPLQAAGRRRFVLWLASLVGAATLLAPWVPFALRQVFDYQNHSLLTPNWETVLPRTWQTFNLGVTVDITQVAPMLWGILAVLIAGLGLAFWRVKGDRPGLTSLVLYLVLPLLVGLAIFRFKPMFHPKYFMMASPAYYLLIGVAAGAFWRNLRWTALPVGLFLLASLLFGINSYFFDSRYWKDDTRTVGRYLNSQATSQDLVISDLIEPLGYYYDGEAPAFYLPGDEITAPERLDAIASGRERVFLVHYEHSYTDVQGLIPFLLEQAGDEVGDSGFRGYTLREYRPRRDAKFSLSRALAGPGVSMADKVALDGWQVGPRDAGDVSSTARVASGGHLSVILGWRLASPVAADYKASITLADEHGHVAAQGDSTLLRGLDPTSRWLPGDAARNYHTLPVFPGVPPGEYGLRLRVYEAASASPGGTTQELRFLGDEVTLGKVVVTAPSRPASFSAKDMGTRTTVQLGPIEASGYTLGSRQFRPGQALPLTIFFKAAQPIDQDYRFRFELHDNQGNPRYLWDSAPLYPTSRWRVGEGVRDWQDLTIPGNLPAGEYHLFMGMAPMPVRTADASWDLGPIQVLDRQRQFAVPRIPQPLKAELDGKLALLGYELEGELRPGSTLKLTIYWQALARVDTSYTVFAHLLDGQNRIWAQHDGIPAGDNPTSGWAEREVIVDKHTLTIRDDAPSGDYILELGMYEPRSGRRLDVTSTQAQVVDQALRFGKVQLK